MGGHVRVRPAPLSPAPLVVPPLRHGLRAGIGHEVVVDVVHAGGHRVGGEHRRREQRLQPQRVARVGDPGQLRAQRPQPRQRRQAGQRPGLRGGQMLELLRRRGPQREAHAHPCQELHVPRPLGGTGQHRAGGRPREERVQQHCPRIPGRDSHRPRSGRRVRNLRPGRRLRLRDLRPCDLGFRDLGYCGSRLRGGRLRRERQRLLRMRPAQAAQHRGLVHPQPPRDLRIPHPLRAPGPRLLPRRVRGLPRPARRADQPRGAVPQRPLPQRRHVVRRQLHQGGDLLAAETELPQHRHRHVPRRRVILGVLEQLHRPGEDHRLAAAVQPVQVTRVRHAIQDGSSGSGHAPTLP